MSSTFNPVGIRRVMPPRDLTSYVPTFLDPNVSKLSRAEVAMMQTSPFVKDTRAFQLRGEDIFARRAIDATLLKVPTFHNTQRIIVRGEAPTRQGYDAHVCEPEKNFIYDHFNRHVRRGQRSQQCALDTPRNATRGQGQLNLIVNSQSKFLTYQTPAARRLIHGF